MGTEMKAVVGDVQRQITAISMGKAPYDTLRSIGVVCPVTFHHWRGVELAKYGVGGVVAVISGTVADHSEYNILGCNR